MMMSLSAPARVRVYDADAISSMLEPREGELDGTVDAKGSTMTDALRASARAGKKRATKEAEDARARRYDRHRSEAKRRQEDAARAARDRVVDQQVKQERRFQELRSDIEAGRRLAEEIDEHLSLNAHNQWTKQKRLFDDWNTRVYGGIQDQINAQLDATSVEEISRRRRADFQKFLDATNSKGAIFRDIIIESEYDPLEPNRNCLKVDTSRIQDPVKRVLDRHHEETTALGDDDGGESSEKSGKGRRRPRPHHREMLETTLWGKGKIDATPHGYFARMMDEKTVPASADPSTKRLSKTYASKIPLDHYRVATGAEVTNAEFPIGKRTSPFQQTSTIFSSSSHSSS